METAVHAFHAPPNHWLVCDVTNDEFDRGWD
jgi:hypothetical protein